MIIFLLNKVKVIPVSTPVAVLTSKPTYYTCGLIYAEPDVDTARMLVSLFARVHPDTVFFQPQFDLVRGVQKEQTTLRVLQER